MKTLREIKANNLIKYRQQHGFTQAEVAEKIYIKLGTYKKYEQQKLSISDDVLEQISVFYKVSPARFLDDDDAPKKDMSKAKNAVETLMAHFELVAGDDELSVIETKIMAASSLKEIDENELKSFQASLRFQNHDNLRRMLLLDMKGCRLIFPDWYVEWKRSNFPNLK